MVRLISVFNCQYVLDERIWYTKPDIRIIVVIYKSIIEEELKVCFYFTKGLILLELWQYLTIRLVLLVSFLELYAEG
jgi:hypothetical protein